jgi:hypothetical protein
VCKTALPRETRETAWRRTRQEQNRYFCQLTLPLYNAFLAACSEFSAWNFSHDR